ncbi:MAG: universal stress protein [Nitrospirae bacterium]|nr:universal stress protein [Nitrospirota bacterium]
MNALSCPIPRLEKLLLTTDGSEFSEGAVREAINLARTCSSRLLALSIVETNPEYETMAPLLVEKEIEKARKHLETVKERAAKENVACEIIIRQGEESFRFVVDEAEKNGTEMIIMGRRGRTGLSRLMMGSVTAKVIGHAPCNVLVVPRAANMQLGRILAATDGSRYGEAASMEAMGVAKRSGATLTVLSVVPSETISAFDIVHSEMQKGLIAEKERKAAECAIKNVKEVAEKEGLNIEGLILEGRPYEAVVNSATEKKADLIVVGSHGRTGLEKLLMGSVTERIIVLSPCAVLVVKCR